MKPVLKQQRSSSATPSRPRIQAHPQLSISMSCLDDFTSASSSAPCISAPTTPDAKMVHFDAQLEHVRLFRRGQKPTAVSRDSSPTREDTTSGGEYDSSAEFPIERPMIAPARRRRSGKHNRTTSDEEDEVRRSLSMHLTNMRWGMSSPNRDPNHGFVQLEGLHLSEDNTVVQGFVRVRNIAFEKSVVIRFTFDGWQTTSEVAATWKESCLPFTPTTPIASVLASSSRSPVTSYDTSLTQKLFGGLDPTTALFDRFSFKIHLQDLMLRIEEKTLVLAICYKTAGEEYWDNNDGQNYRATFERRSRGLMERMQRAVPQSPTQIQQKKSSDESGSEEAKEIKKELNSEKEKLAVVGLGLGVNAKKEALDDIPLSSPSKRGRAPTPGGSAAMAQLQTSKYNFDSALKNPAAWKAPATLSFPLKRPNAPKGLKSVSDKSRHEHRLPVSFNSHWVDFEGKSFTRGSPRDTAVEGDVLRMGMGGLDTSVGRYRLSDATPEDQPFSRLRGVDELDPFPTGMSPGPMEEYFSFGPTVHHRHTANFGQSKSISPPASAKKAMGTVPDASASAASPSKPQRTGIVTSDSLKPSRAQTSFASHGLSLVTTSDGVHGDFSRPHTLDAGSGPLPLPLPMSEGSSELSTPSIVTDSSSPTMTLSPSSPSDTFLSGLPMDGTLDSGYAEFMRRCVALLISFPSVLHHTF